MDFDISYTIDDASQFWDEVSDKVTGVHTVPLDQVGSIIRQYISLVYDFHHKFIHSFSDFETVVRIFCDSPFASANPAAARQVWADVLKQEERPAVVALAAHVLLYTALSDPTGSVFVQLAGHGILSHLLARFATEHDYDLCQAFARLMCGIVSGSMLDRSQFKLITPKFAANLIEQVIEEYHASPDFKISDFQPSDTDSPFPYSCFNLLLALNEQYASRMSSHDQTCQNPIVDSLSSCRTVGDLSLCIVSRFNRERKPETLYLILQLLSSLFCYRPSAECLYTTDLYVVVDIIIRNLYNLPDSISTGSNKTDDSPYHRQLRPLHLQVLEHIFLNTQLQWETEPHKAEEIYILLASIIGRAALQQGPNLTFTPPPALGRDRRSPKMRLCAPPPPPPPRAGGTRLKVPPPPPPPRCRSPRSRSPCSASPRAGSVSPSPSVCSADSAFPPSSRSSVAEPATTVPVHFEPSDVATRELAVKCLRWYVGRYPQIRDAHREEIDRMLSAA